MPDALIVMIVDDSRVILHQLEMIVDASEGVELVAKAGDGACAIRSMTQ